MLAQMKEMAPAGGPPVTWAGWGTLAGVIITATFLIYDRLVGKGKAESKVAEKIDNLCRQIDDMEGKLVVVDGLTETVRELVFEWRGVGGTNGYKSLIREIDETVQAIQKRNDRIDAIHEEDERRSGGLQRRRTDAGDFS